MVLQIDHNGQILSRLLEEFPESTKIKQLIPIIQKTTRAAVEHYVGTLNEQLVISLTNEQLDNQIGVTNGLITLLKHVEVSDLDKESLFVSEYHIESGRPVKVDLEDALELNVEQIPQYVRGLQLGADFGIYSQKYSVGGMTNIIYFIYGFDTIDFIKNQMKRFVYGD